MSTTRSTRPSTRQSAKRSASRVRRLAAAFPSSTTDPKSKTPASPNTRRQDRASLCTFTFSDGRQCRIPRRQGHPYLCVFHAKKEAQALAGEQAGHDIASFLTGDYISAWRRRLRPRSPLLRRSPRPHQTQNRRHPRLPRPNPRANRQTSPTRIRQRLRPHRLARRHPLLLRPATSTTAPRTTPISRATTAPASPNPATSAIAGLSASLRP